ncbi:MAG: CoA transferase [Candidatus Nanopelagicales bacterium]
MPGPLEGVLVLDLGQFLAGPYAPMILSDLGAEVIKIEPTRGDSMRYGAPFIGCQRGKQDLALDLKRPEAQEIVLKLAERADVLHHNMTKGTATRLGVDYHQVTARNPEIVYCNTYAYGYDGPMSISGGIDPLYQAVLGLEYEAGAVDQGNPPMYLRFGMADTANAFASVLGVLSALYHRKVTGQGQDVWTSLLNGGAMFVSEVALLADGSPAPRRPSMDKELTGLSPCYRLYRTQEGWIQVAATTQAQWAALCATVGRPELGADTALATFDGRVAARATVDPVLEMAFEARTAQVWQALLDGAGVPAEIAVDTRGGETVLHDADNRALGLTASYDHPMMGHMTQFGNLIDFSDSGPGTYGPPPLLGEHSRSVLTRFGWSEGEVDDLIERGIVYQAAEGTPYPWPI